MVLGNGIGADLPACPAFACLGALSCLALACLSTLLLCAVDCRARNWQFVGVDGYGAFLAEER